MKRDNLVAEEGKIERHTALPWVYEYGAVYSSDGKIVATRNSNADIAPCEKDANLAYIAKACNAYPALVEALENVVATYRTFRNVPKEEQEWTQTDEDALAACFAALTQAGRGE